ncbi:hypothetical protein MATL_G00138970 [Megalops atlanticus]|uniref:Uncharacterized protein n=1 Tax=Megalops atlanticus TaxID=7932 RepID=A0A9D3PT67_MEGAT|nr:hypothetical protein MATL_G00138970 [Megalops atlanticus]
MHRQILPGLALDPWEQLQEQKSQTSAIEEPCIQTPFLKSSISGQKNIGAHSCHLVLRIFAARRTPVPHSKDASITGQSSPTPRADSVDDKQGLKTDCASKPSQG